MIVQKFVFPTLLALLLVAVFLSSLYFTEPLGESRNAQSSEDAWSEPSFYFNEALGFSNFGIGPEPAIEWIDANWSDQLLPYFLEIRRFISPSITPTELVTVFEQKTGLKWSQYNAINRFVWSRDIENTPDYAEFKARFHVVIDDKFARYFEPDRAFDIRLDEVAWGGVVQDGIPPLRDPKMLNADEANYLEDSDVVFGIEINGDARAYPKRILAWHEMFVDEVGGVPIAGVYCTLCGTVIAYDTEYDGTQHALGTSGFLYRSNKLMYDRATQSLWSTLEGKPVIGPLVGKGIELDQYPVVTSTWGEWKQRHPDTKVLSLETGHRRDYGEGAAYRDYFATDRRMFETPFDDDRLKNKDEVLALRFGPSGAVPVVIFEGFLRENPIYQNDFGGQPYVVLTDDSGANRVYERPEPLDFIEWDGQQTAKDDTGRTWTMDEAKLTADDGTRLERLPAHRAFWFGWHGAFPDTILIM